MFYVISMCFTFYTIKGQTNIYGTVYCADNSLIDSAEVILTYLPNNNVFYTTTTNQYGEYEILDIDISTKIKNTTGTNENQIICIDKQNYVLITREKPIKCRLFINTGQELPIKYNGFKSGNGYHTQIQIINNINTLGILSVTMPFGTYNQKILPNSRIENYSKIKTNQNKQNKANDWEITIIKHCIDTIHRETIDLTGGDIYPIHYTNIPSESMILEMANWHIEHIGPGIIWKYHHFDCLFDTMQSVQIMEIDLNNDSIAVQFGYREAGIFPFISGRAATHTFGQEANAYAAINGTFFDLSGGGGSVCYLRVDGETITPSNSPTTGIEQGGIAFDNATTGNVHEVTIQKRDTSIGWDNLANPKQNIMTSGPLLIYEGNDVGHRLGTWGGDLNSRVAVGVTIDNKFIFVVVDGERDVAPGVSYYDLTTIMVVNNCYHALNMDGGGSSTMWAACKDGETDTNGKPYINGVLNYPDDNGQYDHSGERSVANAVLIVPNF